MLELADKTDLESVGKPCRFEPCYPHQEKTVILMQAHRYRGLFFFRSIFSRPARKFFNCAAKEMCRSFTDNLFDIKAHFTLKSLFL